MNNCNESSEEEKYYEAVESYITSMGWYERLLELQGTDTDYCIASMKVYKAGYLARQSAQVVGALVIESVPRYKLNRELAMLFLEAIENSFVRKDN